MKVDILENQIFNILNPQDLEKYLLTKQWREIKSVPNEVSIWDNNKNGDNFRIWLPLDHRFGDFEISMKRVIKTLSSFENRSQLEILDDFNTIAFGDVIRVKSYDILNRSYNTLRLEDGINLIQKAKEMVIAAACAAIGTKAVFPSRKPNKVEDFIKKIRLAQTERGSYVIKLISPILSEQLNLPNHNSPPPFERMVTHTLMKGLKSLEDIILHIQKKGRFYFELFQEAVPDGVSANLCDAIIAGDNGQFKPFEVSVSLSYIYPEQNVVCDKVAFSEDVMPYIAEASRLFHEKNPEESFILEGNVTKLHREKTHGNGIITVVCISEGKKRRIKVELDEDDYELAIEAHRNGVEVYCIGELIKEGNSYKLNNPSNFKPLRDELQE